MPFEEMKISNLNADLELKLFSAIDLIQCIIPKMKQNKWGRIINVLATGAKVTRAEGAPTNISRAAGLSLTKLLSLELAKWNILVNALCVGRIHSEQWRKRHSLALGNTTYEAFLEAQSHNIPLGRFGTPDEFAALACFLSSEAASYITGTAINVDGGLCPVP